MTRQWRQFLFCLLLIAVFAVGVTAQTATLNGTLTDQTGAVVAGAALKLTNTLTGESYQATTGEGGKLHHPTGQTRQL